MQDLFRIVLENVISEVSLEQLKQQFVDSGKIKETDFKEVETALGGKSAYATWLLKKIADKIIKPEDIYKYKNYFNTFDRRKKDYEYKDINQYKTSDDVSKFISTSVSLRDKEEKDPSQAKGVIKTDKYKEFELGSVDGFKVYEIPKGRKDLYGMSCDLGSGTEWCTATGKTKNHFNGYIEIGPLYIFIKPGSDEKYQFSFESGQYMDENDIRINVQKHKSKLEFLESKGVEVGAAIKLLLGRTDFTKKELSTTDSVKIIGPLDLSGSDIKKLPDGLFVSNHLNLSNSTIKKLPKRLVAMDLTLYGNYDIRKLPNDLYVKNVLNISNTFIRSLPKSLKVSGRIILSNELIKIYGKHDITEKEMLQHPEALS